MKIEFPRLGITSITSSIDELDQSAIVTTVESSRTASSADLRLLARELVAMADELDAGSPSQAEIAKAMVEEEHVEFDNQ